MRLDRRGVDLRRSARECWKTSRIMLPACLADRTFRDALTGAELRPTRAGDTAWVFRRRGLRDAAGRDPRGLYCYVLR